MPEEGFVFFASVALRHNGNNESIDSIYAGFQLSPPERPSQEIVKREGNADEHGPMNTNAYIVVKSYKGNHRSEGFPLCKPSITQHSGISWNWEEWSTGWCNSAAMPEKHKRNVNFFLVSSTEYIKQTKTSLELASFAFATIARPKTFLSLHASARALAKAFMFSASRCGSIVKWKRKWLEWSFRTISPNFNAKSAKNPFRAWWLANRVLFQWKWLRSISLNCLIWSLKESTNASKVEKKDVCMWFALKIRIQSRWVEDINVRFGFKTSVYLDSTQKSSFNQEISM